MDAGLLDVLAIFFFLIIVPFFIYSILYGFLLILNNFSSKGIQPQKSIAIFITGCDSGIGYSLARYCQELGMTVLAGCLQLEEGAFELEGLKNVHVIPLDVADSLSIRNAMTRMNNILNDSGIVLKAVVNNAGIMVFGEFAWLTESLIQQQIQINLIGAMNFTRALLSTIVKNEGRIINICSHCSLEALPGLSVYSASKAGLLAWTEALRVELRKFNVPVISFIPGAFPLKTNIFSKQRNYAEQMKQNMSASDWMLYESYFKEYNDYLNSLEVPKKVLRIEDRQLYTLFNEALLQSKPQIYYCSSPRKYWLYHLLFKITPWNIRDWLVLKFVNMPRWKSCPTIAK